jgi:diaminopimelate epimerase
MRFSKCHGAGNDFVVIDARSLTRRWDELARAMSDRHFGVGSDGLILVCESERADLRMRMFNPDGSEAEACGNGLRCFTKYAVEHGLVSSPHFAVETAGGIRHVRAFADAANTVPEAEVGMGIPRFAPEEIPALLPDTHGPVTGLRLTVCDSTVHLTLVSMGNPHAVCFISEEPSRYPLAQIGAAVEHHALFPARINFEVAHVTGRHEIQARVWERGAGETLACGSGACAISVAAQLLGSCDPNVSIHLPGGTLHVDWKGPGAEVLLRGPAQHVFDGEWPD